MQAYTHTCTRTHTHMEMSRTQVDSLSETLKKGQTLRNIFFDIQFCVSKYIEMEMERGSYGDERVPMSW